jgi:ribosomal protein S18 acetylase RimI-like enzyme
MTPPEIVSLNDHALPAAAAALARAFHDDPLQVHCLPDPVARAQRSPAHFELVLRYGLMFGEVLTTAGAPRGAAVWLGPDAWDVTPERAAAAGLDRLPSAIGNEAADRFLAALAVLDPYHQRDVPAAHWYVMVIGVEPDAQGRGLGRALLQPVMARADARGQPCYLETAQPRNVAFYEHLGFRVLADIVDPTSGLRMWTFRRDPPAE